MTNVDDDRLSRSQALEQLSPDMFATSKSLW